LFINPVAHARLLAKPKLTAIAALDVPFTLDEITRLEEFYQKGFVAGYG
jgi:hypothetical protein